MKNIIALMLILFPCITFAAETSICVQSQNPAGGQNCYPVSPGSPFPAGGSLASSVTNSSSTITAGGTFQTIAAAKTNRQSIDFVNICNVAGNCSATTDECYLYFGTLGSAATTDSIPVAPGQEYLRSAGTIPSAALNATCTTTSDKFYLQTQ